VLTLELLEELKQRWTRQGAALVGHLRPGLSPQQMDAMTEHLDLRLPTEARIWWAWHDGVSRTVRLGVHRELGPNLPFLPLEDAVALYRHAREQAAEVAGDQANYWWRPNWFPITERHGEIRCDCSVEEGSPTPIYWAYSHDHDADGLTNPRLESFGAMVTWWIDAIDSGAWEFNADANRWEYQPKLLPPERERSGLV